MLNDCWPRTNAESRCAVKRLLHVAVLGLLPLCGTGLKTGATRSSYQTDEFTLRRTNVMELLALLQSYFTHCCNDDWEHRYGIRIETLDNPGWRVEIDLVGTQYAEKAFEDFQSQRSDDDWSVCRRNRERFEGF